MALPTPSATPAPVADPVAEGTGGHELATSRRRLDPLLAVALLLPSALVFGVFVFYPFVRTVQLGLYQTNPITGVGRYVGISQYGEVLTSDSFRHSLNVTVKFALLTVPTGLVLGVGLAVLAHQQLRGVGVYRTIFSSTVATSVAVASLMWLMLLNPSNGLINAFLSWAGQDRILFLQSEGWALVSVSAATVWQNLGFTFIVISAGLQSVPDELTESARIDGARPWRRFHQITLPMLSPTVMFATVVLSINAFQSFGQIDLLTQGGPINSTDVLVYSIFRRVSSDPSSAAAQAVVLFGIVLLLTLVQFRVLERRAFYG